jgi:Ras-related protein Rab-5C
LITESLGHGHVPEEEPFPEMDSERRTIKTHLLKKFPIEMRSLPQVQDVKVVLIGESAVGKTAIVRYAITDTFIDEKHVPTVGVSESILTLTVGDNAYRLQLWDTAGQERYRSLAPLYYRGAHAALVVYAVDDAKSFEMLDYWIRTLRDEAPPNVIVFIVGNKIDLQARAVSEEDGTEKAATVGCHFAEVSALSGKGIRDLFSAIPVELAENRAVPLQEAAVPKMDDRAKGSGCC